jgi:hypothetical protein
MSDEETEEYGTVKKKVVDVNIHVGKEGKKTVTDKDAKALAEQLSEITSEDIKQAEYVSEYEDQKRRLHTELAREIGKDRTERSRKKALEKVQTEAGSPATGTATLSGEEATDGEEGSNVDYGDVPIAFREYPSRNAMFADLKKEASNPESEYRKEAENLLVALHRRIGKSREQFSAELQNVRDVARGKKAKWKIKREDEK